MQLKETFRERDIVLRMGGDEFVVYAVEMTNKEECRKHLEELAGRVKGITVKSPGLFTLNISIGCAINDEEAIASLNKKAVNHFCELVDSFFIGYMVFSKQHHSRIPPRLRPRSIVPHFL